MNEPSSFSDRSNARRCANRMIDQGTAPSIDFGIRPREDGRYEIAWRSAERLTLSEIEEEITEAMADTETAEAYPVEDESQDQPEALPEAEPEPQSPEPISGEDPWPPGTPVKIRASRNRKLTGTVVDRVDQTHWRVQLDFAAAGATSTYDGADFEAAGAVSKPWAGHQTKAQHAAAAPAKQPKATDRDVAAARGSLPQKPIVTSKANPGYQKRFDYLAECAAKGDWDAVRNYEVKGINSYAKMVKQYRDRLLSAHAAAE